MKKETVEEFLARGGQIKKYDAVPYKTDEIVRSTTHTPPKLMSLLEGSDYFGEAIKRPRKNGPRLKEIVVDEGIDISSLPASLVKKLNIKKGTTDAPK